MILIYTHRHSNRLEYILDFILEELCGTGYTVTHSREILSSFDGPRINYSKEEISGTFWIPQCDLLFETSIKEQPVNLGTHEGVKILFDASEMIHNTASEEFYPFDIFAASFYLLSRYEEYLWHEKDMYGRYAHINSIASREGFLDQPLVNIWVNKFAEIFSKKYPAVNIKLPAFSFVPTYDIDIAYAYRGKGLIRNAGGMARSALEGKSETIMTGVQTLFLNKPDPFDVYSALDKLHKQYNLRPLYFFLVAEKNGVYDKNILPSRKNLQELIKRTAGKYRIGLHPSWQSNDDDGLLLKEKTCLQKISGQEITDSRQHYIRFDLPVGYRKLIDAGITSDYSMGYGSINGFRASVASPFYWFDLENNEVTILRLFPFCYMEANSFYEQKFSVQQAYEEMLRYYNSCKAVGGSLITIWHNHMLGSDKMFAGWKEAYVEFLRFVSEN